MVGFKFMRRIEEQFSSSGMSICPVWPLERILRGFNRFAVVKILEALAEIQRYLKHESDKPLNGSSPIILTT